MSFDLYVFDADAAPADDIEVMFLLDDETPGMELTPPLVALIDELKASFPGLDEDPDGSPWSSWPLEGNACAGGHGCAFNIAWAEAESMLGVMTEACSRRGLWLFDPCAGRVTPPGPIGG